MKKPLNFAILKYMTTAVSYTHLDVYKRQVYGSSTAMMDLRTTCSAMGSPEAALFSAFVAKMAQFYKVPSWVSGG